MICQSCGTCFPLKDIIVFEFTGELFPINAKWIACRGCTYLISKEIRYSFPEKLVNRCLRIYSPGNKADNIRSDEE